MAWPRLDGEAAPILFIRLVDSHCLNHWCDSMRRIILPLGVAAATLIAFPLAAQPPQQEYFRAEIGSAAPEPTGVITLTSALTLATSYNPSLAAAGNEVGATEGGILQARTLPNPELSVSVEDTRSATRSTTAEISFPLEIGGKRSARVEVAERTHDAAQAGLAATRADVLAAVTTAFFDVLIAQERVALARASADIAAKGSQAAARRVRAGKNSPLEETKARVEQANTGLELAQASAALQSARQTLAALWGSPNPRFSQVQGDMLSLPSRPAPEKLLVDLETSPTLIASKLEIERRKALVDVERSKQYPDVTLSLGAKRDNEANRNMAVIGVSMPLPLFDRNRGNLYESTHRAAKAMDEYLAMRVRLSSELQLAASQLSVSRESALALRETVLPGAQQAFDAAEKGFEAGKFSFLEVLDAQRVLFQARIRYLEALGETYQAASTIDRILGR